MPKLGPILVLRVQRHRFPVVDVHRANDVGKVGQRKARLTPVVADGHVPGEKKEKKNEEEEEEKKKSKKK